MVGVPWNCKIIILTVRERGGLRGEECCRDSCLKISWKSDNQYRIESLFIQTRKDDDKETENVIRIVLVAEKISENSFRHSIGAPN